MLCPLFAWLAAVFLFFVLAVIVVHLFISAYNGAQAVAQRHNTGVHEV